MSEPSFAPSKSPSLADAPSRGSQVASNTGAPSTPSLDAARIVSRRLQDGVTKLLIAIPKGTTLPRGSYGHVDGVPGSTFRIQSITSEGFAVAQMLNPILDELEGHSRAVFESTTATAGATAPIKSRIVKREQGPGGTLITIAAGAAEGVVKGVHGYVELEDEKQAPFQVGAVLGEHVCTAYIAQTLDTVAQYTRVVIGSKGGA